MRSSHPIGRTVCGAVLLVSTAFVTSGRPDQEARRAGGPWDPESGLGNHRAVVRVETASAPAIVRAVISWRRRDFDPEKKDLIVVDATTGARIKNILALAVNREIGDIVFEPQTIPGEYYVYYMPFKSEGRKNYPNVKYDPPAVTADPAWIKATGISPDKLVSRSADAFPRARVVEIQSADEFSAFTPMERIATAAETAALLAAHPGAPYLIFPEDRSLSVRMKDDIPWRWAATGPSGDVSGEAARGEFFTFQIGVWAARQPISDLEVKFTSLEADGPPEDPHLHPGVSLSIPARAMTCFNKGGIDWDGTALVKAVPVQRGNIQALWCGIQVPKDALPSVYSGIVTVAPRGLPGTALALKLRVTDAVLEDRGDSDPYRMTRLRWLDSTSAQDDGIVPPYTPLTVEGLTVGCLGRSLTVGADGLPALITSSFAPGMTRLQARPFPLTAAPVRLVAVDAGGHELLWIPASGAPGPRPTVKGPGAVIWGTESRAGDLAMKVAARMEFDGFVDYKIAITAERDTAVSDIRLEVPYREGNARYMMGLGFKGGSRPETFEWSWDQKKNQDALWLGAVNAGLQVGLRAENYSRPLNTNFYLSKPLNMPPSWWNEGRGKVTVRAEGAGAPGGAKDGRVVVMRATSGPRAIRAGETLRFDFTLLITPFKPLDPAAHFSERYYHAFKPVDEISAAGANVINVHHANAINPYINYPFLRPAEMKAYIDEAHRLGLKVKIYNTVRELSNHAPELFALRSLGHEIFSPGPGGGTSWLQEHLGTDYIAAWFVPELQDAAVINSGLSRWHNYYIEGLDWLARNVGIDGLYLDDVAFDRTTMKRVRKVLDSNRTGALIDLHSANQYNVRDGFASSANLYLEHFPYLNRLWFGEYFDYNGSGPDYWLVELSGIPFGLMGEMLQDGGNPWRGMVFGMTARLPWAGDPRPLWKVWDEFGITESEMVGWWVDGNPVKTGTKDVLATCYVRRGQGATAGGKTEAGGKATLVALASWAKEPVDARLTIDWKALGLDPKTVKIVAPVIDKFQEAAELKPGGPVRVDPGKGLLLILH